MSVTRHLLDAPVPLVLLLLALAFLSGCQGNDGTSPKSGQDKPDPADYPNLESRLVQMAAAEDPVEFANRHDLTFRVAVRVILELEDAESTVPDGILIEGRYENRVQALVPLDRLLEISTSPQIDIIRTPTEVNSD